MAKPTLGKFYICKKCGNIVEMMDSSGVPLVCCGEEMSELIPNTTDGASEKHVPVVSFKDNFVNVRIGSVEHPMEEDHWIKWIYVQTQNRGKRKNLKPGEKPEAVFAVAPGEKVVAVFEYCNKHGLWKKAL